MEKLIKQYPTFDKIWLILAPLLGLLPLLGADEGIENIVCCVFGVLFMVLCAQGKWYSFIFGIIHALVFGWISYRGGFYGKAFITWCYIIPIDVITMWVWKSYTPKRTREVIHSNVNVFYFYFWLSAMAIVSFILGAQLQAIGDASPYADVFLVLCGLYCPYLLLRRCSEFWSFAFVTSIISIVVWLERYIVDYSDPLILSMWIVFFVNSIYGWKKWHQT